MSAQQQRPDGTWGPAESIPYFDTIDWEVTGRGRNRSAVAYWHAERITSVAPGRFFGLRLRIAQRRVRKGWTAR